MVPGSFGWSFEPVSGSSPCVLAWSSVGYAGSAEQPGISVSTEEGSVSLNADDVGRTLRRGECSDQFVITPNTVIVKTLRDRHGKVSGFTTTCDKCRGADFIGASTDRRLPA